MKELSIFIDESGDFGEYDYHAPYYIIAMVFHNQSNSINDEIVSFENKLKAIGYPDHIIHTAPIIRKEPPYKNIDKDERLKLLSITMGFIRKIDIKWHTVFIEKKQYNNIDQETTKLAKDLSNFIKDNLQEFLSYDTVKIYYDNGQTEVKTLINSVFSANLPNIEMKNIQSAEYRLFQVADFICTFDLINKKLENNSLNKSIYVFFKAKRNLIKNFIKPLQKFHFRAQSE